MREVLANATYRHLFAAQIVALLGTGLLTVGLGLFAYELAGDQGGRVLGIALTVKMLAYVIVSPVMAALTAGLSRRGVLVAADLVRAGVALSLPFVTEAWQIYVLIFVLQAASATFTPTFQSILPDVLTEEREYTRALSLSRLAYNLESVISPMLAASLLLVLSASNLFLGTVAGFLLSAALVLSTRLPQRADTRTTGFLDRLTRGMRLYVGIAQLRGLLGMYLAVACATAMIIVNTAVLAGERLGLDEASIPLLLAASGLGEMVVALALPRYLDHRPDRGVMITGTFLIPALLLGGGLALASLDRAPALVAVALLWFLLGTAISMVLTPSGRVIRRNAPAADRPALFAADFSLSHACFILTYLSAGLVGARAGMATASAVLGGLALLGAVGAILAWRAVTRPGARASSAPEAVRPAL
ncbi:MFS transporter [Brachybacterium sp. YJGR34]|uniref:MFS transporter n=1 Tax=Brachybacterium sp. YJGR34 TaxID=2059911 RepID=UPI000E0A1C9B|nr:MFS transporter [Brachybacterium sp. YJGR34]